MLTRLHIQSLAQNAENTSAIWIAVVVLMFAVVLGGVLVVLLRKRFRSGGSEGPALGLTLADLRAMKADGRLSEEEFERAKAMVIGELGGKVERLAPERVRIEGRIEGRIVDGELRARTGFDLTGQPLPDFGGSANPPDAGGDGSDGADR